MGRNLGNPPFATRESLPDYREKELEEAAVLSRNPILRKSVIPIALAASSNSFSR
jgi:hypothetical protein